MNRILAAAAVGSCLVPSLAFAEPAAAVQSSWTPALTPRHELALDASPFAVFGSYAHQIGAHTQVGVGVGVGLDIVSFAPRHGQYTEVVPVAVFVRRHLPLRFQAEAGARGSYGYVREMLDDSGRQVMFGGGYASLFWGGSVFQVGSRVSAGIMSGGEGPAVVITPLVFRLSTR